MTKISVIGGRHAAVTLLVLALTGCEASKSSNPLTPTVAGPIPGVSISAPRLLTPLAGGRIDTAEQPISLVIEKL